MNGKQPSKEGLQMALGMDHSHQMRYALPQHSSHSLHAWWFWLCRLICQSSSF